MFLKCIHINFSLNWIPLNDDVSLAKWEASRKVSIRFNEIKDWLNTSLEIQKCKQISILDIHSQCLCVKITSDQIRKHTLCRLGLQPFWGSQTTAPSSLSAPGFWRLLQTADSWTSPRLDSEASSWRLPSLLHRTPHRTSSISVQDKGLDYLRPVKL